MVWSFRATAVCGAVECAVPGAQTERRGAAGPGRVWPTARSLRPHHCA